MRGIRWLLMLLVAGAWAGADEYDLTLDDAILVSPLPEQKYHEPYIMPALTAVADVPLPPLDIVPALGTEERQEKAQRIEAGATEPVWTPPDKVGVTVRPVADLRQELPPQTDPNRPSFAPMIAEAQDEADVPRSGPGPRLKNDEGLIPKDLKTYLLPPPEIERATVTFQIEQSQPDPVQELLAQPRRRKR